MTRVSDLLDCDRRDERFLAFCGTSSRVAAALVFLIGSLNLLGWFFSRSFLLWTSLEGVVMTVTTAFTFVLAGISLWLSQKEGGGRFVRIVADFCAILVALTGILTLAENLTGWDIGIEPPNSREASDAGVIPSGIAPMTSLNFVLLGGSMLLARRRRGDFAASGMAVAAGFVGLLGLMGYAYGAGSLTHFGPYRQVAFQSTLAWLFLATGILFAMKDRGLTGYLSMYGLGNVMARYLLPAVIIVPVLFGLLWHWGSHLGLYREGFGVALMVLFSMIALACVVWWSAMKLNRSDREREQANRLGERHERELARTADLLEKVFSNIHLKIAYLDPHLNIVRVNQAYADAGGHPPGFYVGKNHFDLYPHGENEEIFRTVIETGEPFSVSSKAFVYPDHPEWGTTYWDWSLQPVKEKSGTVIGLVLSLVDVTETVRAEILLREKEEEAARREKMVLLGEMAAGIAHEVRNPLSGLNFSLSTVETAFREIEGIDPAIREVIKRTIDSARMSSRKIEEVIRRVLDFVRPGQVVMKPIEINEAVREALEMIAPMLRKGGIRVDTALSEDLPRCNGDVRLIEQLVLNLITNAMQAMETLEGEKRVEISSRTEGNRILLAVADSGPGVSESLREKIFAPFFTTRPVGTGLGLSISQRIVSDHKGSIELGTSRFGGAEFRVSLPAATEGDLSIRT